MVVDAGKDSGEQCFPGYESVTPYGTSRITPTYTPDQFHLSGLTGGVYISPYLR